MINSINSEGLSPYFVIMTNRNDQYIAIEMMKLGAQDLIIKDKYFTYILLKTIKNICYNLENEIRLKEAEQRYRYVFEFSPISIFIESNDKLIFANKTGLNFLEFASIEDIQKYSICDFILPEYVFVAQKIRSDLKNNIFSRYECKILSGRDKVKFIIIRTALYSYSEGTSVINFFITDITKTVIAEEKVAELTLRLISVKEEQIDKISKEIHDDLGQELALLKLKAQLLQEKISQSDIKEDFAEFTASIDKVAMKASNLSHKISPIGLKNLGLRAAIQELVESFNKKSKI